jgi:hypothetical protein
MESISYTPVDLSPVRTYSLSERKSLVNHSDFGKPWEKDGSFARFLDSLPNILAGKQIREVIGHISRAAADKKPVIMGMGAHVIKVGLSHLIIHLMEKGVITGLALNGAGIIHDFEVAFQGSTSEDVAASIGTGDFGMARETCSFLSGAICRAGRDGAGLGVTVGRAILEANLPFANLSLLSAGARLGIPVTVHVAMGTDIIHMSPEFDGAAAGKASHIDFRIFTAMAEDLDGGVYLNVGSAVVLPEMFLKAVTLARNLGRGPRHFTTVNLDFIRQYRPMTNVVNRPTANGGIGYSLVGHHEILIPLIAAGVLEKMASPII